MVGDSDRRAVTSHNKYQDTSSRFSRKDTTIQIVFLLSHNVLSNSWRRELTEANISIFGNIFSVVVKEET